MRYKTSISELELSSVQGADSNNMELSSNKQKRIGEAIRPPTNNLSETSSGAILKELSKQDSDRPDLGPFHWLIIAALVLKKVALVALFIVFGYWLFY
jgi:hypothetical protein